MSTDDRTPDTREVRSMYDAGSNLFRETPEQHYLGHPAPDYGAEFDRWLTAHDARVRRDAFEQFAQETLETGTAALAEGNMTEFTVMQVVAEMAQKRVREES